MNKSISLSEMMRSGCSLWTSHPLGCTSHCPQINVQTDKQMHPSAPIRFCQLGPCHRFSGGKNSNIPQNWVISTFSEYSKYHQQTSNPIPFLLHYRKFLSLHKLISVQWMDGPKKKKNPFLFGKFRIDRLTKRTNPCTCLIQNKSTSEGQWGGEGSLQQTVLGSRATCMRDKMGLNAIHKTQFLIDFTSHWETLKIKLLGKIEGGFGDIELGKIC